MKTARPIKVMHVITGLSTGGAETMLLKLVQNMDRNRFRNQVVSLTSGGVLGPKIKATGVSVKTLNMPRGVPHPLGLWRLWKLIRREKPDVIQTWLYHADLLGYFAALLAGNHRVVWNLRCSYMGEDYYRGLTGLIIRLLARLSTAPVAIIVNSETGRALHESRGYKPHQWTLLPNGFDTTHFKPNHSARAQIRDELGIDGETPLVGLVGRFDPIKGYKTFLTAAAELAERDKRTHFLMVGKGFTVDNPAIKPFLLPALHDQLHLLGERADIPAIMAALDVATCASLGEGFPNVVGEAMACGTLCVVTDVGDCREIIGETGWVVPPDDPKIMVLAWREVLALPTKTGHALAAAARQRIINTYNLDSVVQGYQSLYENITA